MCDPCCKISCSPGLNVQVILQLQYQINLTYSTIFLERSIRLWTYQRNLLSCYFPTTTTTTTKSFSPKQVGVAPSHGSGTDTW